MSSEARLWSLPGQRSRCGGGVRGGEAGDTRVQAPGQATENQGKESSEGAPTSPYIWETAILGGAETDPRSSTEEAT